ncbi:MAG: prepilin-type N-terminal cleavage/methylation domain-containing protein [Gammaproteobacteria bacterium]|nr:prepilin-type N-terminal cleavage/methylation domain-containing protein [Gammaproteobacteria bacterium]NIR98052.1 prepilin-type N-terminal cleavage/methylation domain-containing protein [Gammaproteobacteria bacterium]NIT63762.1 prepilin-type N-terminal cleavage/methylation domain-containing protein [Gammaproteobacteria bacterium]NIV20712.1 prepilin-type N-terminal cleavage/methylation domain-containing protein [Gammaproteobacteria bacterium]NIY32342.1 prepilin-type N-terminal cleavage/methyl
MQATETRDPRYPTGGFTLVELVVVIVIIAILASIAYPAYLSQVRAARRADAQAVLMEAAQWMERFYTVNNRYDRDTGGTLVALPYNQSPKQGTTVFYAVNLSAVTQTTFQINATPAGAQANDPCGTLTINQVGNKGAGGPIADCWE